MGNITDFPTKLMLNCKIYTVKRRQLMILMPIKVDSCEIMRTIESLRKEMIQIGIKEGLQSEKTIKISQRLDVFIAQYQSIIC